MTGKLKDILGQEIKVGDMVVQSYNWWQGKDTLRVGRVERLTAKRIYLTSGLYIIPEKIVVINDETKTLVAQELHKDEVE